MHKEAVAHGGQLALVYIAEAHASDEWPINSTRCSGPANSIVQPKSLSERAAVATRMVEALRLGDGGPSVYLDGMDDAFMNTYAAWPTRLYAIGRDGRIEVVGYPEGATFHLPRLRKWLLDQK